MVENHKLFTETFRKHECYYQSFQLSSTTVSETFVGMATVLSANQNEEVWLDFESYPDHKQIDDAISKLMNEESAL
jgi:hypothetical protein